MTEKYTATKDRRAWADKVMHKHDELCTLAIKKMKRSETI